ncbi:hypothetical protein M407DRAFT_177268 [Tulasnella calospora MUT 4182]|uniref:Uncharacterized protein n=1 Tax=Tulasnella calospora MUT 4182 TaxID=1051891 RepID=A0A0C3Q2J6_9AGAM|nr:hypothetical protein M407DRAFT_177268 [Tulasnella calospora MUT 4182]
MWWPNLDWPYELRFRLHVQSSEYLLLSMCSFLNDQGCTLVLWTDRIILVTTNVNVHQRLRQVASLCLRRAPRLFRGVCDSPLALWIAPKCCEITAPHGYRLLPAVGRQVYRR